MDRVERVTDEREERELTNNQRVQLNRIKELLISIDADDAMLDAIDQAILDNEMW